jgi:N-acetylmuramoyl-L-alanine amidase
LQGYKIGVDAGHGDCHPGSDDKNGLFEKDVNLSTALAVKKYIQADGATVVMSREANQNRVQPCKQTDANRNAELVARALFFNSEGVDYMLSVHHNAIENNESANGVLAYVAPNSCNSPARSGNLASSIVNRIVKNNGLSLMQGSGFPACPGKPGVFGWGGTIVTDTKMPAVLSEVSFITNVAEANRLRNPDYLNSNGWAIYAGLVDYLGQTPLPLGNISRFDGAGSLIAPSSCMNAGCDRDVAMMHPHSIPSTVVFQWFNDSNCDHIDISAEYDIGEVVIQSRFWNEHLNSTAYRGRLPLSVTKQGSWNITSVTSTKPITRSTRVSAKCESSKTFTDNYYSRTVLTPELVGFEFDYYWTGNGSLMSFAGTGTGKTQDLAVTFNSHKSLTVFQWYASDSCPRVSISDKMGNAVALDGVQNEVAIKLWYVDDWDGTSCTSLPCPITAPQGENYYLVKIKTDADAVRSGQLKMICF